MSGCGACDGRAVVVRLQPWGPDVDPCPVCQGVGDLCDGWLDCPRCERRLFTSSKGCEVCGGHTLIPCDRRVVTSHPDGRAFCTFHAALAGAGSRSA